ncbi:T9SS type A sorting domain-containing protein [Flavobacterium sp. 3HN19-14]|uniref:T9SS type A sorting domain-containing protein n=1 Tax=Flavobacterium sp. 3HN19-14 TaxID=3448133 RepID=UPI003EE37156
MIIGDFNDYLVGTSSTACACTDSPYKNFTDDTAHYKGITESLMALNWNHPVIENLIVSNELAGNYVSGSVTQEVTLPQTISGYYSTTSDHLPVSATFQFPVLSNPDYTYAQRQLTIYPNPVKDVLQFEAFGIEDNADAIIFDLTGRIMRCEKINSDTINTATLPSGVYLLKVGNRYGRFIKQ